MIEGWSKSSLKSLMEGCSWQWALERIGGMRSAPTPQSVAGVALHAGIEHHESMRIVGSQADLQDAIDIVNHTALHEGESIPEEWQKAHGDADKAAEWAEAMIRSWWESDVRQKLLTYRPVAVEYQFSVPVDGSDLPLRGFIDWVGYNQDGLATVIDWKSASNLKRWGNPEGQPIEAACYLYAARKDGLFREDELVGIEWHIVTRKGETKILYGPAFDLDMKKFLEEIVARADGILHAASFTPKPSWNLCSPKWCGFYHGCQVSGILQDMTFPPAEAPTLPPSGEPGAVERPLSNAPAPGTL